MSLYSSSLLLTSTASVLLGLFVFWQGFKKLPNITLALLSAAVSAWCFGQFMGEMAGSQEAVLFWTRANIAAAVLIPVFYFHFILAFTSQIKEYKDRLILAYLAAAIFLLLDLTPWFVEGVAPSLSFKFYPVPGAVYPFFALYLLELFGIGFVRLRGFIKKSAPKQRNQALYVLFASVIGSFGGATAFFPVFNIDLPVISHFSLPVYLLITVYAMVKHDLLAINFVLREGLIYSGLTVFFAGFYALIIMLANRFFQNLTRFNDFFTIMIMVFISVLVFQPLRNHIQRLVDRWFFKGSYYYQKTIDDLSKENLKLYHGLLQSDKMAALGVLSAGMAHEIKNPLASIKGLTQVLPENLDDPEFINKYAEIVPRQLDRINRIVEDLLDFGQPGKLAMAEVEIARVLEGLLRLVENQCRKSDIEIIREFHAIPKVRADEERLSQVFMNIILNAIQAMPEGGSLKLKTQSSKIKNEEFIIIEISDLGVGIPPERLPNVFDPFYTTKDGGSGMGLAVTYRIIQEHHGEIKVESQVGKGTTFKICLPTGPMPLA